VISIISQYDVVIDGTDNFDSRYLINDACVLTGKPLVYGAIYQFEGQAAVWNLINPDGSKSPNYRDLFPEVDATQVPNCSDGGVVPTIAGIIGCIQANEAIKYITKTGELLAGKVIIFDALSLQSRVIKIGKVTKTDITSLPVAVEIQSISVRAVKEALKTNALELVDVRTDQERDEIDIGGLHFEADEIEANIDYLLNPNVKVLYCSSGKRSGEAVKLIRSKYPQAQVYSLEGGLKAWFEAT
jgi:rhodanese-related sulfurtransferase